MSKAEKAYFKTISNLRKDRAKLYGEIQKGIEAAVLQGEMHATFTIEDPVDRRAISALAKEDGFKVGLYVNNAEVNIWWSHFYERPGQGSE